MSRRRPHAVGVLVAIALTIVTAFVAAAERPEPEVHGVYDGDEMYTLLPPNGIPAILAPEYVSGDEAAAQMSATEAVMGLTMKGQAVCWSTWQLDHHEIVNDVIAGTAIAATW